MKRIEAIEIVGAIMTTYCRRAQWHQEQAHNRDMPPYMAKANDTVIEKIQTNIEALAMVHGCTGIRWPGCWPDFLTHHPTIGTLMAIKDFRDVIAMEYGYESFNIMKEKESEPSKVSCKIK